MIYVPAEHISLGTTLVNDQLHNVDFEPGSNFKVSIFIAAVCVSVMQF